MARDSYPMCAKCPTVACRPSIKTNEVLSVDAAPAFCPMKVMPDMLKEADSQYDDPGVKEFARQASLQEASCYEHLPDGRRTRNTRIEELVQFARRCGYKRLGLAFCGGLAREGRMLNDLLENKGFEVVSVRCKVGAVQKERIGMKPEEKIGPPEKWETMCSPIAQAKILNAEEVDLAVMLGLCIGHDTLFLKYCRVPVTVIAVKDRVTGHNPLIALYLSSSYYARLTTKTEGEPQKEPVVLPD